MKAKDKNLELPEVPLQALHQQRRKLAVDEPLPQRASFIEELLALSNARRVRGERQLQRYSTSVAKNSTIDERGADYSYPHRSGLRT